MERVHQLKELLDKHPDDSFLKYALALEYVKQGEYELAEQYFRTILKQDPAYLGMYYQYGKLLESTGRQSEAVDIYSMGIQQAMAQGDARSLQELREAFTALTDISIHDQDK
ncbi:MAG: tetratricopeptide repeat protein [Thermoflavifilum sp.]|nr:tetratricopeptide repeat protein [Thermoflavifilum sp.]